MKLKLWLFENDMTDKELAKRIGCSRSWISKLKIGNVGVHGTYLYRIEKLTKGKVTLKDLCNYKEVAKDIAEIDEPNDND